MKGLTILILATAITGGICILRNGEVYPISNANGCTLYTQGRTRCGWSAITKAECEQLSCCWDSKAFIKCFNHPALSGISSSDSVPPRPTIYPTLARVPTAPPPQMPISNNQFGVLSTVASTVSYNGCLLHCTSVANRRTCLYDVNQRTCTQVGCCYDSRTSECFHSNNFKDACPTTAECQVAALPVILCGSGQYSRQICEEIGCCYNTISSKPTCYRKQALGRAETPPTAPAAVGTTGSFLEELQKIQDLLASGNLDQLLPSTTLAPGQTPTPPRPTDALDQIQQIQDLLNKGLLPTLLPLSTRNPAGAPVTFPSTIAPKTAPTPTTLPPKTAAGVQRWKPKVKYVTQCQRNGYCRNVVQSCLPRTCGVPPINPNTMKNSFDPRKIVGGSRAFPFSQPWTVMIQKVEGNRTFVCGGSIICARWVITAAHCLDKQDGSTNAPDLNPEMYKLFFGRWQGLRIQYGPQVQVFKGSRDIEALVQHEFFIPGKHRGVITHDIAMIKLRRDVVFNRYVQPICLPREVAKPGEILFATGWGISRGIGPDPNTLKQLGVEVKSKESCRSRVPGFFNPVGVVCAGGEPNQDTCTGDSGGPLVGSKLSPLNSISNRGTPIWYLYGLTSIGSPSCNTRQFDRQPAIYTDIHYYLPWIRKNTADCCS